MRYRNAAALARKLLGELFAQSRNEEEVETGIDDRRQVGKRDWQETVGLLTPQLVLYEKKHANNAALRKSMHRQNIVQHCTLAKMRRS